LVSPGTNPPAGVSNATHRRSIRDERSRSDALDDGGASHVGHDRMEGCHLFFQARATGP
jgi:hypothetical protein